jgi:hypothetical protein
MSGQSSNKDGAAGQSSYQPDAGLDAKLDRAVSSGEPEAFLVCVSGIHSGRVYPVSHNTVFIGRADDADVVVDDPSVSARHARIINGVQGFELEDLQSTNGTFVDGRRVSRARLRSGDRIFFGQVELKFLVDRRVDATMTVLNAGVPAGARGPSNALVRQTPTWRPVQGPMPGAVPGMPSMPGTPGMPSMPGMPGMPSMPGRSAVGVPTRNEDDGPSLEEIIGRLALAYRFVRQNALFLLAFAASGAFLGLLSAVVVPTPGEVVCVLKLQPQVKVNPVDAQWGRGAPEDQEVRFFAGAERAFVQPDLVAGTLHKMGVRPGEGSVAAIAERLKLEAEPDNVYKATYRDKLFGRGVTHPVEFLSAHIDNYLKAEIDRAIRVFSAQADFLRSQLQSVEGDMAKLSEQKMQFSEKNSDRLPEEAAPVMGSRFSLETKRADLTAQIRKLQGELMAQRHALAAEGPLSQQKFRASETYRSTLAEINRKLTDAYARGLADGHPEVRALKDEKERIEALVQKEMTASTDPLDRQSSAGYQDLQNRVALLEGQLAAARSDLADTETNLGRVQKVVGDLPRVQAGVQKLTHMQDATTLLHTQLFEQLKKAELQLNLERVSAESRYEVISPAHLNQQGKLKTTATRGALGVLVGLAVAVAVLLLRKVRDIFSNAVSKLESSDARVGR